MKWLYFVVEKAAWGRLHVKRRFNTWSTVRRARPPLSMRPRRWSKACPMPMGEPAEKSQCARSLEAGSAYRGLEDGAVRVESRGVR